MSTVRFKNGKILKSHFPENLPKMQNFAKIYQIFPKFAKKCQFSSKISKIKNFKILTLLKHPYTMKTLF